MMFMTCTQVQEEMKKGKSTTKRRPGGIIDNTQYSRLSAVLLMEARLKGVTVHFPEEGLVEKLPILSWHLLEMEDHK